VNTSEFDELDEEAELEECCIGVELLFTLDGVFMFVEGEEDV
jgi:hypothetical protein